MKQLKGVLIGAGFFAQFQAEAWKRLEGRLPSLPKQTGRNSAAGMPPLLAAVADSIPGRAQAFAKEFGLPRFYDSAEEAVAVEHPDFVDIATRPDTHLPLTRLAAGRGIHVICQKPMAPTVSESVAMCEVCETAGVRLFIHENWRWQPWYREARRLILAGDLGTVKRLAFDWRTADGKGSEPYAAQPYFRQMPRLLIFESLVHILDTFRFLGGELEVTACETRKVNPVIAGEDWAEIHVRFAGGAEGFIHGDRHTGPLASSVAMGGLVIEGERSTLRIAPDGYLFLSKRGAAEMPLPFEPTAVGYKGDSVFATQQHLIDCLRTHQQAESEGRAYLKTISLVEDCYRLAAQLQGSSSTPSKFTGTIECITIELNAK